MEGSGETELGKFLPKQDFTRKSTDEPGRRFRSLRNFGESNVHVWMNEETKMGYIHKMDYYAALRKRACLMVLHEQTQGICVK